jgi:4-aminobutyrate aminotransferase-like enzyme
MQPATKAANDISNMMRNHGVLISTDGPFDNVPKIKPPIVFGIMEADIMADTMSTALYRLELPSTR